MIGMLKQRQGIWNGMKYLAHKNQLGSALSVAKAKTPAEIVAQPPVFDSPLDMRDLFKTTLNLNLSKIQQLDEKAASPLQQSRGLPDLPVSERETEHKQRKYEKLLEISEQLKVTVAESAAATAARLVRNCDSVNAGKQVEIEFADGARFRVHSAWLKDSSTANVGADFYRTSAKDVWELDEYRVVHASPAAGGSEIGVTFAHENGSELRDTFRADWLRALSPFVGLPVGGRAETHLAPIQGTGSVLDGLPRVGWASSLDIPTFEAAQLRRCQATQIQFLEATAADPGVAMILNVGPPPSLDREAVGAPLEAMVLDLVGHRLNQHPVRATRYGVMRKSAESSKQGADYDLENPLSMHTDHSVYDGTPGFLQFMYQAQGTVHSKVCDGFAIAEHIRAEHPAAFELLTTVHITHSSRNTLYTREGVPRDVHDGSVDAAPFELVHTHPIIQLDPAGKIEKVVQSETKRGVSALPYNVYEPFMDAYATWMKACEDARFIKKFEWPEYSMICTNNWRTLHGRAMVPPEMARTMVFGYVNRQLTENRYRLLRQMQKHNGTDYGGNVDPLWLTRLPNQVLRNLVSLGSDQQTIRSRSSCNKIFGDCDEC